VPVAEIEADANARHVGVSCPALGLGIVTWARAWGR
jgi:hypothetical protein